MNKDEKNALNLSEFVRTYREDTGLSQVELAKKLGISQASISKIENGIPVHIKILQKIAAIYDMPYTSIQKKLNKPVVMTNELLISDFMKLYNKRQPIIVKILKSSRYEYGELFPAIIGLRTFDTAKEKTVEFVVIYNYDCILTLNNYKKTWTAYRYSEELMTYSNRL